MSWANPVDMDTLSDLPAPPPRSRGRSSKRPGATVRGGSKSERRLLMEAKASIGSAIAEDRKERLLAKRRARKFVRTLYYAFKIVGVAACVYTSGLNTMLVYMRPQARLQDRFIRCYLILFGIGGVLAELDTPFAKANFRALQKWWFKAPFYVFMAWLCLDVRGAAGTSWFPLEVVSFVALQAMAIMSVVLSVCLREVLERSGALGKRKKSRRARGAASSASSKGRRLEKRDRGGGGGSSSAGGLGVSSFRERDRRRSRPSSVAGSPRLGSGDCGGGNASRHSGVVAGMPDRRAPEMVPERSGRFLSPTSTHSGSSRLEPFGANDNDRSVAGSGSGGRSIGGAITGKLKWWLDRSGEDDSPGGGRADESAGSPVSASSISTGRSGRTRWWEDSDGDDDGASSMASFAFRDDASDAGSVMSGYNSVSATGRTEGGRYGSLYGVGSGGGGRKRPPFRRAPPSASSRVSAGSVRGGLEQRPPPLAAHGVAGSGMGAGGGPGGMTGGGGQHVALTAQALARNLNEAPSTTGRGLGFGSSGPGTLYASSAQGGSVAGSVKGGFGGSQRAFGTRRTGRRPGWDGAGSARAASVSGDALRGGGGTGWEFDASRTASEAGGDDDQGDDGRYSRPVSNNPRTPGIQDYTPF